MGRPATLLPLALVAALGAGLTHADPDGPTRHHDHDHDHDRARAALASGAIRPLNEVLAAVSAAVPGDVVAVELEQEAGLWVYEVKVITAGGHLRNLYVDGATATLSDPEEQD